MSDGLVIACPGCGRKLRLSKRPPAGKQLQCPKCDHKIVFQIRPKKSGPTAAPTKKSESARPSPPPARKKKRRRARPQPAETFDDDYGDDLYGGDDLYDDGDPYANDDIVDEAYDSRQPAASRRRRKSSGKKTSKKTGSVPWLPILAMLGVVGGFGLVGSLAYMLWPAGGSDSAGNSSADAPAAIGIKADVALLPMDSEVVVHVNVQELLSGPLKELMKKPQIQEQLAEIKKRSGSNPEDVETVTIGLSSIQAPQPDAIVIVRTKTAMTLETLQQQLPGAQPAESPYSDSMLRLTQGDMETMWLKDPRTMVGGSFAAVRRLAEGTSIGSSIDLSLTNPDSQVCGVFAPKSPAAVFGSDSGMQPPPMLPVPGLVAFMTIFQQTQAVGFAVDMTVDLEVAVNVRSNSTDNATKMSQSFTQMLEGVRPMIGPMLQSVPPEMQSSAAEAKKALESLNASTHGSTMAITLSMPGSGITLAQAIADQMLPAVVAARGAATRTQSKNNLKQLLLAMHNYHDVHGQFPPAASTDTSGQPLLSWRVHLLPYLEEAKLYEQFHLDEPWDSPHNQSLVDRMPNVFELPGTPLPLAQTVYLGVVGDQTVMQPGESVGMRDITDGTSNTILVVEANAVFSVTWTAPEDFSYSLSDPQERLGMNRPEGFLAGMADGTVHLIAPTIDSKVLVDLFQMSDGNEVNAF